MGTQNVGRGKRRQMRGICHDCAQPVEKRGAWRCTKHSAKKRAYDARYSLRLKREVFNAYGGVYCACPGCDETRIEFLQIDHVNDDGAEHRRQYPSLSGITMLRYLKRNGFPEGFQVLCANCNGAKGHYPACPHHHELAATLVAVSKLVLTY